MHLRWIVPAVLASLLAGCGSIGAIGLPFGQSAEPAPAPAPLPAAPTTAVESSALPPIPGQTPSEDAYAQGQSSADMLATNDSSGEPVPADAMTAPGQPAQPAQSVASGAEVGRTDLLGGWTIAATNDSCQLFMTLTSWTGGYRASTRGCSSPLLTSISAWSLNGNQVVLAGSDGTTLARLYASGAGRFDGQAENGGGAVSFYR
jgi:hypothetical protein